MIEYVFIEPSSEHLFPGIVALYRAMGWWDDAADDPLSVSGLIGGSHAFLAALEGGTVIGVGRALSDRESDAYVQDVAVRADRRRQGIGGEIVRRLVARLEDDGIGWIGLVAEPGATQLYGREGFTPMPGTVAMVRRRQP
jgi:GNAT superfamily N-acetyltransferase